MCVPLYVYIYIYIYIYICIYTHKININVTCFNNVSLYFNQQVHGNGQCGLNDCCAAIYSIRLCIQYTCLYDADDLV